jgi:LPXTG-motif cell wall-anchored protein
MKACPFCAEEIQDAAVKCKHCGSNMPKKDPRGYALLVFGIITICIGMAGVITAGYSRPKSHELEIGGVATMVGGVVLVAIAGIVGRKRRKS